MTFFIIFITPIIILIVDDFIYRVNYEPFIKDGIIYFFASNCNEYRIHPDQKIAKDQLPKKVRNKLVDNPNYTNIDKMKWVGNITITGSFNNRVVVKHNCN